MKFFLTFIFSLCLISLFSQKETISEFDDMSIDDETEYFEIKKKGYPSKKPSFTIKKKSIDSEFDFFYGENQSSKLMKYGLLKNGQIILPQIFTYLGMGYGDSIKSLILGIKNAYGVYSLETESWKIPLIYDDLKKFNNNLYIARVNGKYGLIDVDNNIIIDFKWYKISKIDGASQNYVKIQRTKYTSNGVYNINDKKLSIPCIYKKLTPIENGTHFYAVNKRKYNIIDFNNKARFETWYDFLRIPTNNEKLYLVKKGQKMGVINDQEKEVVPIEFLQIARSPYKDGSFYAKNKQEKYGCMRLDGHETLPFVYDSFRAMFRQYVVVALSNEKYGVVRINSGVPREIVACKYDTIVYVSRKFIVKKNNLYGLINSKGTLICKVEYDTISTFNHEYGDVFIGKKQNKYFIFNFRDNINSKPYKNVERLIIPNYNHRGISTNYIYLIVQNEFGKYGVTNLLGKEIVIPTFDDIRCASSHILTVQSGNKLGLYGVIKKELILPLEYDQLVSSVLGYIGIKNNDYYKIETWGEEIKVVKL